MFCHVDLGFGAGTARSRGIWLEPEPSLWRGSDSGSSLNFSLIIHANCMVPFRAGCVFLDSRSRVIGVLGTWARGNAIFFKARVNAEREEVEKVILRA